MTQFNSSIVRLTSSARKLSGTLNGEGDKTASYAGPGQHVLVHRILDEMIEGPVTAKGVLALVEMSNPRLKALATDKTTPRKDLKTLRPISRRCLTSKGKVDAWASGRYLAAILYVYVLELRREERAAKGAAKVTAAA